MTDPDANDPNDLDDPNDPDDLEGGQDDFWSRWSRESDGSGQPREPRDSVEPTAYPSPVTATLLTLGAFAALVIVTSLFVSESFAASIGLGQALGIGAVATLAAQRVAEPRAERLGLRVFPRQLLTHLLFLLPATLLLSELDNIITGVFPPPALSPEEEELLASMDFDSFYGRIQLFIILVGIKPVIEEWLFRGVIQQGLVENMGRAGGVILTALLFAPIYSVLARTGTSFTSALSVAFCAGLLFGIVRLATGSLLASTLLSAGLNAVALAAGWFEETIPIAGYNAPGDHTSVFLLLAAAALVALGLVPLVRLAAISPITPPAPNDSQARSSSRE